MKKIYSFLIACAMILMAGACTNLDEVVYSELPAEGFFTNEESLIKNVGRAYAWLSSSS